MTTETLVTCDARTGYRAGEWGEEPLWCHSQVGLTRYTDSHGIERAYCRHHGPVVRHRYPVGDARVPDGCVLCGRPDDDLSISVRWGAGIGSMCHVCQDRA